MSVRLKLFRNACPIHVPMCAKLLLEKHSTTTKTPYLKLRLYYKHDDFDFEIVNYPFLTVMFLALHPMEFIFINASDLLEPLAMLLILTLAINCSLRNS